MILICNGNCIPVPQCGALLVLALAYLPLFCAPGHPTLLAFSFFLFPHTLQDPVPVALPLAILYILYDVLCCVGFNFGQIYALIRSRFVDTMTGEDSTGSAGPSSPKDGTSPVGKKGSGPSSPTGASPGPSAAGILPAQHWVQTAEV